MYVDLPYKHTGEIRKKRYRLGHAYGCETLRVGGVGGEKMKAYLEKEKQNEGKKACTTNDHTSGLSYTRC
jgi:hypothetical protein